MAIRNVCVFLILLQSSLTITEINCIDAQTDGTNQPETTTINDGTSSTTIHYYDDDYNNTSTTTENPTSTTNNDATVKQTSGTIASSITTLDFNRTTIPANTTFATTKQNSSSNPKNTDTTFFENPTAESTTQLIVPLETRTSAKITSESKAEEANAYFSKTSTTTSSTTKEIKKTSNINSNNTMFTIESRSLSKAASSKSSYQATENVLGSIVTFVAVISVIY